MEIIPIKERKRFNGKICNDVQKYLKGNELRLYMLLCQYHNNNYDYAHPTYEQIREYFGKGWDNKRIRGHLEGLEKKGFISVEKNKKKGSFDNNIYRIFGIITESDKFECIEEVQVIREKLKQLETEKRFYITQMSRFKNNDELVQAMSNDVIDIESKINNHKKEIRAIKKSLEGQSSKDFGNN